MQLGSWNWVYCLQAIGSWHLAVYPDQSGEALSALWRFGRPPTTGLHQSPPSNSIKCDTEQLPHTPDHIITLRGVNTTAAQDSFTVRNSCKRRIRTRTGPETKWRNPKTFASTHCWQSIRPRCRPHRWRSSPLCHPPPPQPRPPSRRAAAAAASRCPSWPPAPSLYARRRHLRRGSPPAAWFPNRDSSTARTAWSDYTRSPPQGSPRRLFTATPCIPTRRLPSQANTPPCPTRTRTARITITAATPSNCQPAPSSWTTGSGCPQPGWCCRRCRILIVSGCFSAIVNKLIVFYYWYMRELRVCV